MKQTNATLAFATLILVVFAATFACNPASDSRRGDALPLPPIGSSGDVATQIVDPQDLESNPLRATFALYPTELAFGDAAYYTLDVENVSDSAAYFDEDAADRALNESTLSRCVARVAATVDGVPGEYVAAPELATLFVRAPSEEPQPSTLQPINDATSSGMRGSVGGQYLE
ncbi:MAG: hypothetical protein IJZ10_03055, partial [Thermoguttaceae bacterium]|nr:hypothetical protein [Thermoguttaceae bacterium]